MLLELRLIAGEPSCVRLSEAPTFRPRSPLSDGFQYPFWHGRRALSRGVDGGNISHSNTDSQHLRTDNKLHK